MIELKLRSSVKLNNILLKLIMLKNSPQILLESINLPLLLKVGELVTASTVVLMLLFQDLTDLLVETWVSLLSLPIFNLLSNIPFPILVRTSILMSMLQLKTILLPLLL
jgi:hypothetical protein